MIVVLSYSGDIGTTPVLNWLERFERNYKRINLSEEDITKLSINIRNDIPDSLCLKLNDGSILDIDKVSYFFYRGGSLRFYQSKININHPIPLRIKKSFLKEEVKTLLNFFYQEVSKKCLGNLMQNPINKLEQLSVASKLGLNVPDTYITSSKTNMNNLSFENGVITKSIQENIFTPFEGDFYELKVKKINLDQIEDDFFPSLFQPSIDKQLEIRTFYLDGQCYSIAMLDPEEGSNIPVDFRERTSKLRYAVYNLPSDIKNKIIHLMDYFKLNTGSIDLLFDKSGRHIFLEINPTGQYGWVSDFGNYNIPKLIAEYLIDKDIAYEKERNV